MVPGPEKFVELLLMMIFNSHRCRPLQGMKTKLPRYTCVVSRSELGTLESGPEGIICEELGLDGFESGDFWRHGAWDTTTWKYGMLRLFDLQQGKGLVKVNGQPLSLVQPEILRFKVRSEQLPGHEDQGRNGSTLKLKTNIL